MRQGGKDNISKIKLEIGKGSFLKFPSIPSSVSFITTHLFKNKLNLQTCSFCTMTSPVLIESIYPIVGATLLRAQTSNSGQEV